MYLTKTEAISCFVVNPILKDSSKLYIYGTSREAARLFFHLCSLRIFVEGFVDESEESNITFFHKPVYGLSDLPNEDNVKILSLNKKHPNVVTLDCVLEVNDDIDKDNIIIYGLGFMALFILPDGLGMGAYKYMLPYYLTGYYVHGYMENKGKPAKKSPRLWMIGIIGLAFAGLFIYYNEDSFIYLTGYKLVGKKVARQLGIDIYRLVIGFAGSVFFILVWQYILMCADKLNQQRNGRIQFGVLRKLGADSMGIYIVSGYLLIFVIQRFDFIQQPSYIFNIFETIIVLAMSWLIVGIIGKIPVLKKVIGKK